MINKQFLTRLFLLLALLLQTSCITKYIWGDKSYDESIDQFFVGSDGRYIAFIGADYHYIFTDNSGLLRNILSLRQKGVLLISSEKTHLKLNKNNDVAGDLVLEGPGSVLPREDLRALRALGIVPDRKDMVTVRIALSGRRYAPRYLGPNPSRLQDPYELKIYYNDSNAVKDVGKAAVTPIAITLDAVLLIGKIVVAPLSL